MIWCDCGRTLTRNPNLTGALPEELGSINSLFELWVMEWIYILNLIFNIYFRGGLVAFNCQVHSSTLTRVGGTAKWFNFFQPVDLQRPSWERFHWTDPQIFTRRIYISSGTVSLQMLFNLSLTLHIFAIFYWTCAGRSSRSWVSPKSGSGFFFWKSYNDHHDVISMSIWFLNSFYSKKKKVIFLVFCHNCRDLSDNNLSGGLPENNTISFQTIQTLNLSRNNFSGGVPPDFLQYLLHIVSALVFSNLPNRLLWDEFVHVK